MNNNIIFTHSLRFILLVFIQVLVFKQMTISWGDSNYVHIIVYPLFLMLLPIRIPDPLLICLGFLIGITVDMFYESWGVHASASVFVAFARPFILKLMTPRGGYNINHSPSMERFGFPWFLVFASSMLFLHLLFYFIVSIFTHIYWVQIILRTIFSFLISLIIILIYVRMFGSRE